MTEYHNWNDIYRQNAPKLLGVCRRYVRDISTAEDILHDSFLQAMKKVDTYQGKGVFEAWLMRITINTTLNYLRKNSKNRWVEIDEIHIPAEEQNVASVDEYELSSVELLDIIDALPIHHKTVFNLYVIDGFSHQEISEQLDISVGTSKSHLYRARKKIKELIEEKKKKKRRIAAFWFITNSETMDKLFKDKFKDFEISPKRDFKIENAKIDTEILNKINGKKSHSFKYLMVGSIVLMLLIGSIWFINHSEKTVKIVTNESTVPNENLVSTTTIEEEVKNDFQKNSMSEETPSTETKQKDIRQNNIADNKQETLSKVSKKELIEKKESRNLEKVKKSESQKENSLAKKEKSVDSLAVEKNIAPVVIKKTIIKRDTIYVQIE